MRARFHGLGGWRSLTHQHSLVGCYRKDKTSGDKSVRQQVPKGRAKDLHKTIKATMKATLGGGELRKTVQLPPGEDENEWIAVNSK